MEQNISVERKANQNLVLLSPYIGFDKIELNHLTYTISNPKLLISNRDVRLTRATENTSSFVLEYEYEKFQEIKITDNKNFNDLIIGLHYDRNRKSLVIYTKLVLTISTVDSNNLNPWTYTTYDAHIKDTIKYIANHYGIQLNTSQMTVSYAEVNVTIPLENDFYDYKRVFKKYLSYFPLSIQKYDGTGKYVGNPQVLQAECYYRGNKSQEIILYNKTKEIMTNKNISPETELPPILRIENRLLDGKKIRKAWGTDIWNDLDMKKIYNYFYDFVYKDVESPNSKINQKEKRDLKKIIEDMKIAHPYDWVQYTINYIRNLSEKNEIPFILDIEELCEAIKNAKDKNSSRKAKYPLKYRVPDDVLYNNDREKLMEILSHITEAYNNSISHIQ